MEIPAMIIIQNNSKAEINLLFLHEAISMSHTVYYSKGFLHLKVISKTLFLSAITKNYVYKSPNN